MTGEDRPPLRARLPFRLFRSRPRRPGPEPDPWPVAPADRFRLSDLLGEATADIGSRPGRLVTTIVGTVLGIAALITTVGLAQTAAGQIARQFDANAATQLVVSPRTANTAGGATVAAGALPWDAVSRLERLSGIESVALLAEVSLPEAVVTAVPVNDPSQPPSAPPPIYAASEELLDTVGGRLATGRFFDAGHDERADRVAVLGFRAAERLGVQRIDTQPSVFVDGIAYAVVGVVRSVDVRGELLDAVILPTRTARADFGLVAPGNAQARIAVGAGPQLRTQAALTLAPDDPESLEVRAPSGRSELGRDVQADVNVVFVVLAVIVLLAGGVGIANVTMLSVLERVGEIGLRRAVGATGRQIAGQFVAESVVIGLLGGSSARRWACSPSCSSRWPGAGPRSSTPGSPWAAPRSVASSVSWPAACRRVAQPGSNRSTPSAAAPDAGRLDSQG
ncbi:ABC transporter permease [Blastococcus sp. PRF04-17]|uniref:ABC transporter permease n=1 Tax=Blastococcus sp. PRF04-17 TaxID=2933797 RepID=UPI001FF526B2|nr:ABC transporter permease [Blastococcus sp. PRF04-17]UOY00807.1 ABC transporter permease [Blastococcus sp. PRF04-17]